MDEPIQIDSAHDLTPEEKDFILRILHDTVYSGKPAQLDALLALIRGITDKLQAPPT